VIRWICTVDSVTSNTIEYAYHIYITLIRFVLQQNQFVGRQTLYDEIIRRTEFESGSSLATSSYYVIILVTRRFQTLVNGTVDGNKKRSGFAWAMEFALHPRAKRIRFDSSKLSWTILLLHTIIQYTTYILVIALLLWHWLIQLTITTTRVQNHDIFIAAVEATNVDGRTESS
jgi:hypothetical protein